MKFSILVRDSKAALDSAMIIHEALSDALAEQDIDLVYYFPGAIRSWRAGFNDVVTRLNAAVGPLKKQEDGSQQNENEDSPQELVPVGPGGDAIFDGSTVPEELHEVGVEYSDDEDLNIFEANALTYCAQLVEAADNIIGHCSEMIANNHLFETASGRTAHEIFEELLDDLCEDGDDGPDTSTTTQLVDSIYTKYYDSLANNAAWILDNVGDDKFKDYLSQHIETEEEWSSYMEAAVESSAYEGLGVHDRHLFLTWKPECLTSGKTNDEHLKES